MRRITATRLNTPLVIISMGGQAIVAGPAVGRNYRAYPHDILDETNQRRTCYIGNLPETHSSKSFGRVNFNGNDDYGFCLGFSATNTLFRTTNVRFINLNVPAEHLPAWPYHGKAQLVQPGPSSLIAPQPEHSLQAQSTYAKLHLFFYGSYGCAATRLSRVIRPVWSAVPS